MCLQKFPHPFWGREKRPLLFSACCSSCQAHTDFLFLALPAELRRGDPTLAAGQGIQLCVCAAWGKAAAHSASKGQPEFGRVLRASLCLGNLLLVSQVFTRLKTERYSRGNFVLITNKHRTVFTIMSLW